MASNETASDEALVVLQLNGVDLSVYVYMMKVTR